MKKNPVRVVSPDGTETAIDVGAATIVFRLVREKAEEVSRTPGNCFVPKNKFYEVRARAKAILLGRQNRKSKT